MACSARGGRGPRCGARSCPPPRSPPSSCCRQTSSRVSLLKGMKNGSVRARRRRTFWAFIRQCHVALELSNDARCPAEARDTPRGVGLPERVRGKIGPQRLTVRGICLRGECPWEAVMLPLRYIHHDRDSGKPDALCFRLATDIAADMRAAATGGCPDLGAAVRDWCGQCSAAAASRGKTFDATTLPVCVAAGPGFNG